MVTEWKNINISRIKISEYCIERNEYKEIQKYLLKVLFLCFNPKRGNPYKYYATHFLAKTSLRKIICAIYFW